MAHRYHDQHGLEQFGHLPERVALTVLNVFVAFGLVERVEHLAHPDDFDQPPLLEETQNLGEVAQIGGTVLGRKQVGQVRDRHCAHEVNDEPGFELVGNNGGVVVNHVAPLVLLGRKGVDNYICGEDSGDDPVERVVYRPGVHRLFGEREWNLEHELHEHEQDEEGPVVVECATRLQHLLVVAGRVHALGHHTLLLLKQMHARVFVYLILSELHIVHHKARLFVELSVIRGVLEFVDVL